MLNIIPIINSIQNLEEIISLNKKFKVGIHIDTGINRLGIPVNDLDRFKFSKKITIIC